MLRHTAIFTLLAGVLVPAACGQQPPRREPVDEIAPQLHQLLEHWSRHSSGIEKMRGEVARRIYEHAFAVERLAEGRFYYEAPDKGRLDLVPGRITTQMVEHRQRPEARVRRDDKGQPYRLELGGNERWICDGKRIFSINDDDQRVDIAELPEGFQGANIMNSPLPFLFGMPPKDALRRFDMNLKTTWTRNSRRVQIEVFPKWRQDGSSWKKADVILDTKTWLPIAVRLEHPSGDRTTVYSFADPKVNGLFDPWWRNPWKPDLRDYSVNVSGEVLPDLTGEAHTTAAQMLVQRGIPEDNIRKLPGGPATQKGDVFRVRQQEPTPGTLIQPDTVVTLYIWERMRR